MTQYTLSAMTLACAALVIVSGDRSFISSGDRTTSHEKVETSATFYGDAREIASRPYPTEVDPKVVQTVELLHFITPYHVGLETLTDITAYSPILRALKKQTNPVASLAQNASANEGTRFYAFVDTWVGDHHGGKDTSESVELDGGKCSIKKTPVIDGDGNGWGISADLLFYPRAPAASLLETGSGEAVDTRPRHSLTLASGWFGSTYDIGDISVLEGSVGPGGTSVVLDNHANMIDADAVDAACFRCAEGAKSLEYARHLGDLVKQAKQRGGSSLIQGGSSSVADDAFNAHISSGLLDVGDGISNVDAGSKIVHASYDAKTQSVESGAPVFFSTNDVKTEDSGRRNRVGSVIKAADGEIQIQMEGECLPMKMEKGGKTVFKPALGVAKSASLEKDAAQVADALQNLATSFSASLMQGDADIGDAENTEVEDFISPMRLDGSKFVPLDFLGDLVTPNRKGTNSTKASLLQRAAGARTKRSAVAAKEGERVCVLKEDKTGRFLEKEFDLPSFEAGGAALLQLAVSGHGWEKTKDKCGEFCEMVYHLSFNGQPAQVVSEWRSDCANNPTPSDGTWQFSRNGWCPGSVQPGVFLDVTKHLQSNEGKATKNTIGIDVSVLDGNRKSVPYLDVSGYLGNDHAILDTAANLFVYDKAAVDAIKVQATAFSAAEKAIRQGVSVPEAIVDPSSSSFMDSTDYSASYLNTQGESSRIGQIEFATSSDLQYNQKSKRAQDFLSADVVKAKIHKQEPDVVSDGRHNFEATAPWYNFKGDNLKENGVEPIVVSMFKDEFIHFDDTNGRVGQSFKIPDNIPEDFSHVAIHFKLDHPKGLDFDHWDRVGSLGIAYDDKSTGVTIHTSAASKEQQTVNFLSAQPGQSEPKAAAVSEGDPRAA